MSLCQLQGEKTSQQPKTQQKPKILPLNHLTPQKNTQQLKPYKTKMEPTLRTKRILMSYGLSGDMGYLIPAESKAKAKSS